MLVSQVFPPRYKLARASTIALHCHRPPLHLVLADWKTRLVWKHSRGYIGIGGNSQKRPRSHQQDEFAAAKVLLVLIQSKSMLFWERRGELTGPDSSNFVTASSRKGDSSKSV